jgi:uncharacterized repeat protein (TIGR03943 family)
VTKATQNLLLILVGAAVLWITLGTGEYLNYVKPGFRYLLVPSAVALLVLGAAGLRREWREASEPAADHDHSEHAHGEPRVAWLLCLPVAAIFVVAPPALGSFSAARKAPPPPTPSSQGFGPLPRTGGPVPMTMGEFIGRSFEAQTGQGASLSGVRIQLTGFVTPAGDGWRVTRLKMACCAGDAVPFPVAVRGLPQPPADAWVRVVGTWRPTAAPATGVHELQGLSLTRVPKPKNAYE